MAAAALDFTYRYAYPSALVDAPRGTGLVLATCGARHEQPYFFDSDTVAGAKSSANLYSVIVTAKANGLEPHAYLRHVLTELPKATTVEDIEALLPTRIGSAMLQPLGG